MPRRLGSRTVGAESGGCEMDSRAERTRGARATASIRRRRRRTMSPEDTDLVRRAWAAYREAREEAERRRQEAVRLMASMRRTYPLAAIARAAGLSTQAVWAKLRAVHQGA
jgi:hypothetical protein